MAELTLDEQAYQANLQRLYEKLRATSADPNTPIPLRKAIQPHVQAVATELDELDEGLLHRGTVELQAAAGQMAPAMKLLSTLKSDLDKIGHEIQLAVTISGYVEQAIETLKPLLG